MSTAPEPDVGSATVWEAPRPPAPPERGPILVPLVTGRVSELALAAARGLASGLEVPVLLLNAVAVPEQTPLSVAVADDDSHVKQTDQALAAFAELAGDVPVSGAIRIGHHLTHIIESAVRKYDAAAVVADDSWETSRFSPDTTTAVESRSRSLDSAVVYPTGAPLPERLHSILVPVVGGSRSTVASDLAQHLATAHDAHVELLHVAHTDSVPRRVAAELLDPILDRFDSDDDVDTWVLEATDPAATIVEQSQYYDVTVIGAPRSSRLRRFVFGSTARTVQRTAVDPVLTVWT